MHTPVLLNSVLEVTKPYIGGRFIDCTGGEGGYTKAFLENGSTVLTLDADEKQCAHLQTVFLDIENVTIVRSNFKDIFAIAKKYDFYPADVIVFDLGLSYKQMIQNGKGFSYKMLDDPLDMRLSNEQSLTSADILNTYSEEQLVNMLEKNSEEVRAYEIARQLVASRKMEIFKSVRDLENSLDVIHVSQHTKARVYQALRIEVNDEFESLRKALHGAYNAINDKGIIVVVSFHSVEDRIVKFFAQEVGAHIVKPKIKKRKSFERSAVLKVIKKNI